METLLITTLIVSVPAYAWLWHGRSAGKEKEQSRIPERELLWAGHQNRRRWKPGKFFGKADS